MKKILSIMLPLVALVACVNVGGGNGGGAGGQPMSQFSANGVTAFLTAPISFSPTNLDNPSVGGQNSCYTVTTDKNFIYYPTTSCYTVAVGGGSSPATTPLTSSLNDSRDIIVSASMDESGNGYFNVSPQRVLPYILKCNNVINGGGGTCLSPSAVSLPTGAVLGARNTLVNDVYGRLYMIAQCPSNSSQQCVMMSSDGAQTWQSITSDAFITNYSKLRFSSLFVSNIPGTPSYSTLYVVMQNEVQGVGKVSQMMSAQVPSSPTPSSYSFLAWAGQPYATNVLSGVLASINPATNIFYQLGSVGNNYNTPGYLVFYGHNPNGPVPAYYWQSESVNYNNPSATGVASVSFDNSNHIFITLTDNTSYYGQAPQ